MKTFHFDSYYIQSEKIAEKLFKYVPINLTINPIALQHIFF